MHRREFIALVTVMVAGARQAAAQQPNGTKRVAILNGSPETPDTRARVVAFQKGLAEAGWREGQIIFEVRWGGADADRIRAYATELVKLNPDVILATNTPTARSLKLVTDAVPIVFAG
jgi:putative ABC transport system substrate-binding protein